MAGPLPPETPSKGLHRFSRSHEVGWPRYGLAPAELARCGGPSFGWREDAEVALIVGPMAELGFMAPPAGLSWDRAATAESADASAILGTSLVAGGQEHAFAVKVGCPAKQNDVNLTATGGALANGAAVATPDRQAALAGLP